MPLPRHRRKVARIAEHFRRGHRVGQGSVSSCDAVLPAEQGDAGRMAFRGVVELGEPQAVRRKLIEIRGLDLGAIAADIREPEVVGHDDHDVWPVLSETGGRKYGYD